MVEDLDIALREVSTVAVVVLAGTAVNVIA